MPMPRFDLIPNRRAIIDRRALAERLAALPDARCAAATAHPARGAGRRPRRDRAAAGGQAQARPRGGRAPTAFLTDQILRLAYDFVTDRLHPLANPTRPSGCC